MLCVPHQIFVGLSNRERDGRSIWHVRGIEEVHTGFWLRDLRKTAHLEDLGIDENIILKLISKKWDWKAWRRLLWPSIGTGTNACECVTELSGYIKSRQILD